MAWIENKFGKDTNSFHAYRMIAVDPIKDIKNPSKKMYSLWCNNPTRMFERLLPWIFYYLKCYLPLTDIVTILYDVFEIRLTTHQVFHMVFQHSDSLLRGFCIEHYSYSHPIPFYYPTFATFKNQECTFEACKELWYSIRENRGLVSFGLGQAAFGHFGKSSLLDFIFETNFAEGNPRDSPFHFKSVDIQMTNNLYSADPNECTKWAFIDCNGYVGSDVIHIICRQLDIAIIHVSYHDYTQNKDQIMAAIHEFDYLTHLYVFIRDCEKVDIMSEIIDKIYYTSIPNIVQHKPVIFHSKLKNIGYKILHLPTKPNVGRNFIESTVRELQTPGLKEIQKDHELLNDIMGLIRDKINFSNKLNFSCLNFYPIFIQYMSFYYSALHETIRDNIMEYNRNRVCLKDKLDEMEISKIVKYFNKILKRKNSVLILWKLSQDLSALTDEVNRTKNISEDTEISTNDKYNLEILWREALLSYKYGKKSGFYKRFQKDFAMNFSNYVERGEAFELIDGDNLRYFNQEINALLSPLYTKQSEEIENREKCSNSRIKMKQAPIVVSIFGPQSSGKSTLLNYCFGCKFLTSAGRCTRGIYASLAKLSTPVNCSDQLLILDTEGLDAVERGNAIKHFDRTMVLFCLAVSQIVIVNISSDLGEQMQNLLQICACSLLKLKVSKVAAPKVFFVLNQQVDPDKKKHIKSINILLKKLDDESNFMETEGRSLSELINVSKENLFILPSAFNSNQINTPTARLFDSKVTKQSSTEDFADSCADLRLAIINSLRNLSPNERPPFKTMGEWMEMSGVIWDIIVKYQDIVKHKNIQEMKCYNVLNKEITRLMEEHKIYHRDKLVTTTAKIVHSIDEIKTTFKQNVILQESMKRFDDVYQEYQEACYTDFSRFCSRENLITDTNYICEDMKSNLEKLLDIERNPYRDEIQNIIRACWYDQNISDLKVTLIEAINKNIDINLDLNEEQLRKEYERIWSEWSSQDLKEEEENERNKDFDDLYTLFKMESKMMENKHFIFELFNNSQFQMDKIIQDLKSKIIAKFESSGTSFSSEEDYIYPWRENNQPLKEMIPYTGKTKCVYIRQDSLFNTKIEGDLSSNLEISDWIPKDCTDLIQSCSGLYNHADITWKREEWLQIKILASCLKDPDNPKESTWCKLVRSISLNIESLLMQSIQVIVKEVVHLLCSTFKHVNHEINYIQANLTNKAEMTITTLAFAYLFKHRREMKMEKLTEYLSKKEEQKLTNCKFFLEQVNNRKLARGNWDRMKMRINDEKSANGYALDFLERVKRGALNDEAQFILEAIEERKEHFSHKTLMLFIDDLITKELSNQSRVEVTDINNIVIKHICDRNEQIKIQFNIKWEETVEQVYRDSINHMKSAFQEKLLRIRSVVTFLLAQLSLLTDKEILLDSDYNFELANSETYIDPNSDPNLKESPLRAMTLYLKMYLDPNVIPEHFKKFFEHTFMVDDIEMSKNTKTWKLCEKPNDSDLRLSKETFKKLTDTKMFYSDNIFNINRYIKELLCSLSCYEFELTKPEYQDIISCTKYKYLGQAISCPEQCPSCGKFCDIAIGHVGKCRITTGHQICSMGGKVWRNDDDKTAVLITCDDYKESTEVKIPGRKLKWEEFKDQTVGWDWDIPKDENYQIVQDSTYKRMQLIWNKYGRGILNYYSKMGINIRYIPYTSRKSVMMDTLDIFDYRICFVIDGTGSMRDDIVGAKISVSQLISKYQKEGHSCEFAVVIYRDHCDGKDLLDKFPVDRNFTNEHRSIQKFLEELKVFGGGDGPEAVLDGLATAINNFTFSNNPGIKHKIVHIFDAPPHGNFPDYESHSKMSDEGNCCCCNKGKLCKFDWKKDVWKKMRRLKIEYHGINTGREFPQFTATMEENLEAQFGGVQEVDKKLVNEAVFHIFIEL